MDRDALREFARRDWKAVHASKSRYWQELKGRLSAAEILALADRLRVHTQRLRPDWPTQRDSLDDLLVHQRVGEALRAVTRRPR